MPNWIAQGSHRYYCESDTIFFECHGVFTKEDTEQMIILQQSIAAEYGYYLLVFDARDGLTMSPEGRRRVSEATRVVELEGDCVLVGASFVVRTLAALMVNALMILSKKKVQQVEFCATLEEIPVWLASHRQRFHQRGIGRARG